MFCPKQKNHRMLHKYFLKYLLFVQIFHVPVSQFHFENLRFSSSSSLTLTFVNPALLEYWSLLHTTSVVFFYTKAQMSLFFFFLLKIDYFSCNISRLQLPLSLLLSVPSHFCSAPIRIYFLSVSHQKRIGFQGMIMLRHNRVKLDKTKLLYRVGQM